ncbi:MAG: NADH dehydrogenase ubiquinone Fe-S protein 4 [Anaplasma sp.]
MSDGASCVARVYRPSRSVVQSGVSRNQFWYVEFPSPCSQYRDSLMGWTGSKNTTPQVRLRFPNRKEATSYVKTHGIPYVVLQEQVARRRPKSYSENFLRNRGL